MNGVSANWAALLEAATRLQNNGAGLDELVNAINSDITSTQDAWQGQASQAYQEQWAALLPKFKQAAVDVQTMGQQITTYVSAQQSLEEQAKSTYRV